MPYTNSIWHGRTCVLTPTTRRCVLAHDSGCWHCLIRLAHFPQPPYTPTITSLTQGVAEGTRMARATALVDSATLVFPETEASPITVNTPAWFAWLEHATTFAFRSPSGHFTARKERQARGDGYWKAYRTSHGTLHRVYLGKAQDLTLDRLNHAATTLAATSAPAASPLAVRTASPAIPVLVVKARDAGVG